MPPSATAGRTNKAQRLDVVKKDGVWRLPQEHAVPKRMSQEED